MFLLNSQITSIAVAVGLSGINIYTVDTFLKCNYGDRAGASYVVNLGEELKAGGHSVSFYALNDAAYQMDLKAYGIADTVKFFAYSGHGLRYDYYPQLNDSSATHFFAQDGYPSSHDGTQEGADKVNATWDEVRLGHGANGTRWASFYSCNWLTNGGSSSRQQKIGRMFEGLRLMTGFASVMYLDSREGSTYGNYLRGGNTIINSWFAAARKWQPQNSADVIVRVYGYRPASSDTINSNVSAAPNYVNYYGDFTSWDTVVVGTGQRL
jgi:Family of unknown function (DUF6345)